MSAPDKFTSFPNFNKFDSLINLLILMLKEIGQKLRMLVNYRWKLFDDNYFDKAIPSGALFHRFTVNFDTVNQEQASVNRARPRPDAINFARSTMMEPGGSYL